MKDFNPNEKKTIIYKIVLIILCILMFPLYPMFPAEYSAEETENQEQVSAEGVVETDTQEKVEESVEKKDFFYILETDNSHFLDTSMNSFRQRYVYSDGENIVYIATRIEHSYQYTPYITRKGTYLYYDIDKQECVEIVNTTQNQDTEIGYKIGVMRE